MMRMPSSTRLVADLRQEQASGGATAQRLAASRTTEAAQRAPVRVIRDTYPAYSSVAVDVARNEVVMTDENLFQILVYDRLDNTPPQAAMTEPKRRIGGAKTKIEFQCDLYIDPETGEIYAVNNDTMDTLVVFSRKAEGNVAPDRELHTPHGTFGIAVDEESKEMYLTVQHDNAVVVYRKGASGEEAPVRLIQGDRTRLADPHGIALDRKNNLLFVSNYGSFHQVSATAGRFGRGLPKANWPLGREFAVPGSGKFYPPAITVHSRTASGDVAPLRIIEGPKTQLNWPTGLAVDVERGELFVANDMGNSILVFRETDQGDVAPIRVLKGPRTGIQNPTDVFIDAKNDELWVANFGNHTVTVYKRTAEGNSPPLRVIRSAPRGVPSLMIGNPGAVAYDSKRQEILVPN